MTETSPLPDGWTVVDRTDDDLVLGLTGSEDLPWPPIFRLRRLADDFQREVVARLVAEQRLSLADCAVVHMERPAGDDDRSATYFALLVYRSGLIALASYQWFMQGQDGAGTVVAVGTCLAGDSAVTAPSFEQLMEAVRPR